MPRKPTGRKKPVGNCLEMSDHELPAKTPKISRQTGRSMKKVTRSFKKSKKKTVNNTVVSSTTIEEKNDNEEVDSVDSHDISAKLDALSPLPTDESNVSETTIFGPTPVRYPHLNPQTGQPYSFAEYLDGKVAPLTTPTRKAINKKKTKRTLFSAQNNDKTLSLSTTATRSSKRRSKQKPSDPCSSSSLKTPVRTSSRIPVRSTLQTRTPRKLADWVQRMVDETEEGDEEWRNAQKTREKSSNIRSQVSKTTKNASTVDRSSRHNFPLEPAKHRSSGEQVQPYAGCSSNSNGHLTEAVLSETSEPNQASVSHSMEPSPPKLLTNCESTKKDSEGTRLPCSRLNCEETPRVTHRLAKQEDQMDDGSPSLRRKTPRRSCIVVENYEGLDISSEDEYDSDVGNKSNIEDKEKNKEKRMLKKELLETEKTRRRKAREYDRLARLSAQKEEKFARQKKREEKRAEKAKEEEYRRQFVEMKRDMRLQAKIAARDRKLQKEFVKKQKILSNERLQLLSSKVEQEHNCKKEALQNSSSQLFQRRTRSESPSYIRRPLLEPKMHLKNKKMVSMYLKEMNEAIEKMKKDPKTVRAFATRASHLGKEHFFISTKDPFYQASLLRMEWANETDWGGGKTADYMLKLSEDDPLAVVKEHWTSDIQSKLPDHFGRALDEDGVAHFAEQFGIRALRSLKISTVRLTEIPKRILQAKASNFVDKALFALKLWKNRNPDVPYPRIAHYFMFCAKRTFGNNLDSPDFVEENYIFPRNLCFWLPIHLANLQSAIHVPREVLIDLARQLFTVIIDEWPMDFVTTEELESLYRLQLASLRLECYATSLEDLFPYWKPVDSFAFVSKSMQSHKSKINKGKEKTRKGLFLELEASASSRPSPLGRRRCNSFSEFEDCPETFIREPTPVYKPKRWFTNERVVGLSYINLQQQ